MAAGSTQYTGSALKLERLMIRTLGTNNSQIRRLNISSTYKRNLLGLIDFALRSIWNLSELKRIEENWKDFKR